MKPSFNIPTYLIVGSAVVVCILLTWGIISGSLLKFLSPIDDYIWVFAFILNGIWWPILIRKLHGKRFYLKVLLTFLVFMGPTGLAIYKLNAIASKLGLIVTFYISEDMRLTIGFLGVFFSFIILARYYLKFVLWFDSLSFMNSKK